MTQSTASDRQAGGAGPAAPARPLDPRMRAVVATVPLKAGTVELHLECGHVVRRRVAFCAPALVICTRCPGGQTGAAVKGVEPLQGAGASV